jgi:hypothetical protein
LDKTVATNILTLDPSAAMDRTRSLIMSVIVLLVFIALGIPSLLALTTVIVSERFSAVEPDWLSSLLSFVPAATSQPAWVLTAIAEMLPLLLVRTCFNSTGNALSRTGAVGVVILLLVAIASALSIIILDPSAESQAQNITGGALTLQALDDVCANAARACLLYAAGLLGLKQFAKTSGANAT